MHDSGDGLPTYVTGMCQETWGAAEGGAMRCSRSLVDMWTALCAVAEENTRVAAAHIVYAAALERALTRAALQHVLSIEKLCQVSCTCHLECAQIAFSCARMHKQHPAFPVVVQHATLLRMVCDCPCVACC